MLTGVDGASDMVASLDGSEQVLEASACVKVRPFWAADHQADNRRCGWRGRHLEDRMR